MMNLEIFSAVIERYKNANPSMFAWEIRDRLLLDGMCPNKVRFIRKQLMFLFIFNFILCQLNTYMCLSLNSVKIETC